MTEDPAGDRIHFPSCRSLRPFRHLCVLTSSALQHEVVHSIDPKTKMPVCTKLILAFKERKEGDKQKTRTPLVDVNPRLIKKLKPHQWEGISMCNGKDSVLDAYCHTCLCWNGNWVVFWSQPLNSCGTTWLNRWTSWRILRTRVKAASWRTVWDSAKPSLYVKK